VAGPNHGLANGVRKAVLVPMVAEALAAAAAEAGEAAPPLEIPLETMQLAMLLEVAGRESEVGYRNAPDVYMAYKAASCAALERAAKAKQLGCVDECTKALERMYTGDGVAANPWQRAARIFEVCHELDLLRCLSPQRMGKKVKGLRNQLGPQTDALLRTAEAALRATGDRVVSGTEPSKRVAPIFARCSTDGVCCVRAASGYTALQRCAQRRYASAHTPASFVERVFERAFQRAFLSEGPDGAADSAADDAALPAFFGEEAQILGPKEYEGWLSAQLRGAEEAVLAGMSAEEKQQVFSTACVAPEAGKPLAEAGIGPKDAVDEPDEEDASAVSGAATAKLKKVAAKGGHDALVAAWKALPTSSNPPHPEDWHGMRAGQPGFNERAREIMRRRAVPALPSVRAPIAGSPCVQPYQETVSYLAHPSSQPNCRMLVVHRTGAGKTCSMIRVVDNFFKDRRPKILLFPTPAVCSNFQQELLDPKFPNRYAHYLHAEGKLGSVRKGLELSGCLMHGRVRPEFVSSERRPSAPLRAFSYTQAGGVQSCGAKHQLNAVFKCPDGYAGGWNYGAHADAAPEGGYLNEDGTAEFKSDLERGPAGAAAPHHAAGRAGQ
jgi:hypothetical protein